MSDADVDVVSFASVARFGEYWQFSVGDANEMDESSASSPLNQIVLLNLPYLPG